MHPHCGAVSGSASPDPAGGAGARAEDAAVEVRANVADNGGLNKLAFDVERRIRDTVWVGRSRALL